LRQRQRIILTMEI